MCAHGDVESVQVYRPEMSGCDANGETVIWAAKWYEASVDRCIAPIVRALVGAGICTVDSCCGHGTGPGTVILADGRVLVIYGDGAQRGDADEQRKVMTMSNTTIALAAARLVGYSQAVNGLASPQACADPAFRDMWAVMLGREDESADDRVGTVAKYARAYVTGWQARHPGEEPWCIALADLLIALA